MGHGRATQWGGAKRTIRQLLDLPEGGKKPATAEALQAWDAHAAISGKKGASEEQKAALLHSHRSFRALFAKVPDTERVTELVAAAWLGIATRTLNLGLTEAYPAKEPATWRTKLAKKRVLPAPKKFAFLDARFRWAFVRDVLPGKFTAQIARAEARRDRLLEDLADKARTPVYPGPVAERIAFLVDANHNVLHAFGQAHVTAAQFISLCDQGARMVMLSPVEALGRPWRDTVARNAWEGPVREALALAMSNAKQGIVTGAAGTENLVLEFALPAAGKPGRKKPL
jgi:hypothetical protein